MQPKVSVIVSHGRIRPLCPAPRRVGDGGRVGTGMKGECTNRRQHVRPCRVPDHAGAARNKPRAGIAGRGDEGRTGKVHGAGLRGVYAQGIGDCDRFKSCVRIHRKRRHRKQQDNKNRFHISPMPVSRPTALLNIRLRRRLRRAF